MGYARLYHSDNHIYISALRYASPSRVQLRCSLAVRTDYFVVSFTIHAASIRSHAIACVCRAVNRRLSCHNYCGYYRNRNACLRKCLVLLPESSELSIKRAEYHQILCISGYYCGQLPRSWHATPPQMNSERGAPGAAQANNVVGCYVLFVSSCYGWGDGPGMADRYR
jgi:hypothetical protein